MVHERASGSSYDVESCIGCNTAITGVVETQSSSEAANEDKVSYIQGATPEYLDETYKLRNNIIYCLGGIHKITGFGFLATFPTCIQNSITQKKTNGEPIEFAIYIQPPTFTDKELTCICGRAGILLLLLLYSNVNYINIFFFYSIFILSIRYHCRNITTYRTSLYGK